VQQIEHSSTVGVFGVIGIGTIACDFVAALAKAAAAAAVLGFGFDEEAEV